MTDAVSAYDDIQMWMESLHVKDAINAHHKLMQAIKAARIAALEEAAKVCERERGEWTDMSAASFAAQLCADRIRDVIEKETSNAT